MSDQSATDATQAFRRRFALEMAIRLYETHTGARPSADVVSAALRFDRFLETGATA